MSNIYEKLEQFNKIILTEAVAKRDSMLGQIRQEKQAAIDKKRAALQKQADDLLYQELKSIDKEKNDIISKAFIESRQLLRETREKIVKAVLDDLNKQIQDFVSGNQYPAFLEKCIEQSCIQAGKGEVVVTINSRDFESHLSLLLRLQEKLGIALEKADEDINGGCRVLNKTTNLFIDNSISSRICFSEENFYQTSCLRID